MALSRALLDANATDQQRHKARREWQTGDRSYLADGSTTLLAPPGRAAAPTGQLVAA
jgi:hypothetical protein